MMEKMVCKVLFICCVGLAASLGFRASAQSTSYNEPYRPQYHFSPKANWINDPCGMVYLDGEYHLMYQYNPFGTQWGSMSWGHAVSRDLVHWEELPVALYPDAQGQIFSGGAVIDHHNTAGFGAGAMVAIYTSAGDKQKQSIAYSLNKGRTWRKYTGNPVLPNRGVADFRDPQVFWHEKSGKWIMTLAVADRIEFYSSPDLKNWGFESSFGQTVGAHGGVWECPDLFRLTVAGQAEPVWVLMVSINPGSPSGGSGTQYFLGNFDGSRFTLTEEFRELLNQETPLPEGVLFEDFEESNYSAWAVTGTAFGAKPAAGTLPGQQVVTGYRGRQLVNSYLNGDGATGKLTSPAFTIQHEVINLLVGGGNHPGGAEVRLLVDGQVVASSTGQNEEKLRWKAWNVNDFIGKQAFIEIVDEVTGSWGHLNVDHIYFSDTIIEGETREALWTDYGPDFYAGRSWENQPQGTYERVWLAWMNNWSYAGNLPTSTWRGSMSLPRALALRRNGDGQVRLYQTPVQEVEKLRAAPAPVSFQNQSITGSNQQLAAHAIAGTRYEVQFVLVPGNTTAKTGIQVRKGGQEVTEIGYDPETNAIYLDRSKSGVHFSGGYAQVFYAPLEKKEQELRFRIFVDESSVEVFVNDGALVQTARIFPSAQATGLSFFGAEEVRVKSFNFWPMGSIWQKDPLQAEEENPLAAAIQVYPNPSQGTFRIRSRQPIEAVEFITLSGQRLPIVKQATPSTDLVVQVPQAGVVKGLHFLQIKLKGGGTVTKKVVLQ
ncbi:GH32 C-terminal domain-containing protein [Rufibacter psychrotolerans]|uniref:GH32 C-terminal domain-containing protein n=1 Tax=Rufibacter psychrotolerans TaxID=2812556 RepID=UPI00293D5AD6|nr:GH32 C-terminal domain-containing protein [Rufibacter sp. SYSU D00308]